MASARCGPLVLPAAALFVRAGREQQLPALEALVYNSTDSAQLYDDLLDASDDLERGRQTYVVRSMGGQHGAETLRRSLYLRGGFHAVLQEALAALDAAREKAEELGMRDASDAFVVDAQRMEDSGRRLIEALEANLFREVVEQDS